MQEHHDPLLARIRRTALRISDETEQQEQDSAATYEDLETKARAVEVEARCRKIRRAKERAIQLGLELAEQTWPRSLERRAAPRRR